MMRRWASPLLAAAIAFSPIAADTQGFGPAYPFVLPANTLLGNASNGATVPQNVAVNSCGASGNGLTYTSGTGFGCATNLITGSGVANQIAYWTGTNALGGTTVAANHAVTGGASGPIDSLVTITKPATGSTLTIADGKTLTANNNITVAGADGSTLTLGGALTTSGAFATTLTVTGTTSVTLPTSGTLATTAGTVASFSAGTTGLTPNSATTGAVTLAGTLGVGNGGTNCAVASIACFNNITGLSAAGTTGTTSANLVFSASPTLTGSLTTGNITGTAAQNFQINAPSSQVLILNAPTGQIGALAVNGAGLVDWSATAFYSQNDSGMALGGSSNRWNGAYITLPNTATTSAVCVNTSTFQLSYDGTLGTCTVSGRWAKHILSAFSSDDALAGINSLDIHEDIWKYRQEKKKDAGRFDDRVHVGLIADDVAKMDDRCVGHLPDGRVADYDDRCVLAYAIGAIKEQQKQIMALRAELADARRVNRAGLTK